ncbi:hypothetical protein HXA35_01745 [Bacillus sp. A301a_S52]|nr:hypothetical protein [Bacillus sp. A301a_S52]
MMRNIWVIEILFLVIITFIVVFSLYTHHKTGNEEMDEFISEYGEVANRFTLGTYHSYSEDEEEIDIILFPTENTQYIMDRWKVIAELTDYYSYPIEAVKSNNWLEVNSQYINISRNYADLFREDKTDINIEPDELKYYIFNNAKSNELEDLLKQEGLE